MSDMKALDDITTHASGQHPFTMSGDWVKQAAAELKQMEIMQLGIEHENLTLMEINTQLRAENEYLKGVGSAEAWKVEAERLIGTIATLEAQLAQAQEAVDEARGVILRLNRLKHNDGGRSYPDQIDIEAAVAWLSAHPEGEK